MKNWMSELSSHYEEICNSHPQDELMIVFDVDGTILDMRYLILHVLQDFDRNHHTHFFQKLKISDITVHENRVENLLDEMKIESKEKEKIIAWYEEHRWTPTAILKAHRPFPGVLETIRWFQIQPRTHIGLNTGRPESIREETLSSLNKLGEKYRISFRDELLHMNPSGWEIGVAETKVAAIRYFWENGYRVFAMIDNEPATLKAISKTDDNKEILLLHANTIFESKRTKLPPHTVRGKDYDLTDLIPEKALPQEVQFAWHGVNDEANLRQFLASEIEWGECDVLMDPIGSDLILRHDSFAVSPLEEEEDWFTLDDLLPRLSEREKSVKFDMKTGGMVVGKVLEVVDSYDFDDSHLWFNGNVEQLQEDGFRELAARHPKAILQCPVDFLSPLIESAPDKAKEILDMFRSWGVNRFSISWKNLNFHHFFDQMDQWGFEVNIYNVPDLESFLEAVLLIPRSVTSDFNFPKWHYYGRGSGESGEHIEYSMRKTNKK